MMRKTLYPLLAVFVFGAIILTSLPSCRKDHIQLTIKQYDSVQIQQYIASHGLTGFQKDTTGGDTSGIYYKILLPGYGNPIQYSDKLPFVYSERTFDGTYALTDTISQHFYDFVGHLQLDGYPLGVQTTIHNLMVYPNAAIEVLVPSHLAYGKNGKGSGSSTVSNNRIAGNQCMDWYIHGIGLSTSRGIVYNTKYDDLVIRNYMRDSSLTGYSETPDSVYYKVLTPGTGTDTIRNYSTFVSTYTGQLLNGTIFDGAHNGSNTATFPVAGFATPGNPEILEKVGVPGAKISIILPSKQGYGVNGYNGIPPFAPMRFTWQIISVSP